VQNPFRPLPLAPGTLLACLSLTGCRGSPSALDPQGPAAERLAQLWWAIFAVIGVAVLITLALVGYALFARRSAGTDEETSIRVERRLIIGGGIALPLVLVFILMALNVAAGAAVQGHSGKPAGVALADAPDVEIEVIGHRFWWEIRYRNPEFVTANELHIPVGRPVAISLTSIDVIHSFWVPQLHGKIDLTPGRTTYLVLEADRPGVFRGQCAEFCGIQHALMGFLVVAEVPELHEEWRQRQAQPAEIETEEQEEGLRIFVEAGCGTCHAIAGTEADGRLGPDLSNFGARRTIGAATVVNNRGNLGGWIIDPQSIKPGNLMPPQRLESDQLLTLLDFLEGLG
jgi:cytochrome c oxidase subunit II